VFARAVLAVCLVALFTGSGCDGGQGRLSSDEFEQRADAACGDANDAIDDVATLDTDDPDRVADRLDEITRIQRGLRDRLALLAPPADDQETYDEWIAQIDAGLTAFDDLAAALRAGDLGAQVQANEAAVAASERVDAASATLRLSECREPDAP